MAYPNTKRPRGRPVQHKADQLRAMYWFHCIVDGYENLTAYTLERLVNPGKVRIQKGSTSRPGLFDDYRDGKKVPLDNDKENSIVAITDEYFRGSAKIFRDPIWDIFKEKSVSKEAVHTALDDLGAVVELLFLEPAAKYGLEGILIKSFEDKDFDAIQRVSIMSAPYRLGSIL